MASSHNVQVSPWLTLFLCLLLASLAVAQLSKPLRQDSDLDKSKNKFRAREANTDVVDSLFEEQPKDNKAHQCHVSMDLLWTAELGYSIYSTPLITDMLSDGQKDVVSGTYVRYVEVLEAADGHRMPGWPYAFQHSSFHASPLLYDIDKDGQNEVVMATANGEIVFLRQDGLPVYGETLRVPPLEVHQNWYQGLDARGTDANMQLFGQDAGKETSEHKRKLLASEPLAMQPVSPQNSSEYKQFKSTYDWLNTEAHESLELFLPDSELRDRLLPKEFDPLQSPHYAKYAQKERRPGYVYVDPHILCTPVIADIDGDGRDELIVSVSYYYDREHYSDPSNFASLNADIDITKYVAGGLVVFDLEKRTIKWKVHLDLTTLYTTYRAYIYASPTVVDLTGDGKLNIIVGTSLGFIYAFDEKGTLLRNFPVEMDEIQGQLAVADVNGDGKLEILAVDNNANLVLWDRNGLEIWERRLSGFPSQAPMVGDVNGDGILDIVVGTDEGHIWAVQGTDGKVLKGFPIKTKGRILASVLLMKIHDTSPGLHIIVPSFDGYVYAIDGASGCGDRIDLGETAFAQVLADDLTGNGKMDLLVTTMNGNAYAFATEAKYHPLKAWTAQADSRNGFTYKHDYHGIYVLPSSRKQRDVPGAWMTLQFEIVDKRPKSEFERRYDVRVSLDGTETLLKKTYSQPGVYQEQVQCRHRRVATVRLEMTNEQQQYFADSFAVSFNLHFYRTLKWILVFPFILMAAFLFLQVDADDEQDLGGLGKRRR